MTRDDLNALIGWETLSLEPDHPLAEILKAALRDIVLVFGDRWWPAHETLEGAVRNLVNVAVLDEEVRAAQKFRIEELEAKLAGRKDVYYGNMGSARGYGAGDE